MIEGITASLIASVLFNAGKYGINKVLQKDLDGVIKQAVKDCIKDHQLQKELISKINDVFKSEEVKKKVLAFENKGEIIPTTFFEQIFIEILGPNHGKMFATDFFTFFYNRLAEQDKIFRIILLNYERNILFQVKKKEKIDQSRHERVLQEFESLKKNIEQSRPGFFAQETVDAKIGVLNIPDLPKDYVKPQNILEKIDGAFERKKVILVYGSPGSGKSIAATTFAKDQQKIDRPVFWFRFEKLLTDKKSFDRNLLAFLTEEKGLKSKNLNELISTSRALMVFDDLQFIQDEDLKNYIYTFIRFINDNHSGIKLLCTTREQVNFLPSSYYFPIPLSGLTEAESLELIRNIWKIDLKESFEKQLFLVLQGHPQYLVFFKEWYFAEKPDTDKLDQYFAGLGRHDPTLQNYLMNELFNALGGVEGMKNRLLEAVAFPRIPGRKEMIEDLFSALGGKHFNIELQNVCNRMDLIQYDSNTYQYDLHDILRDFYYNILDKLVKEKLHLIAAAQYSERKNKDKDKEILYSIEEAHHYQKAGKYKKALESIIKISDYCIDHGNNLQLLKHLFDHIIIDQLMDDNLKSYYYFTKALIYQQLSYWDEAIEYFKKDLELSEKNEDITGIAKINGNLGNAYFNKGDLEKSLEYNLFALFMFQFLNDYQSLVSIYNNIGLIYFAKGEIEKSIEHYQKSLELIEDDKNGIQLGEAQIYGNLGSAYYSKGDLDKAIEFYHKDLDISKEAGDKISITQSYNNLGLVYQDKGKLKESMGFYYKSLNISNSIGDIYNMANTYGNISTLNFEKGYKKKAFEQKFEVLIVFLKLGANHKVNLTLDHLKFLKKNTDSTKWNEYYNKTKEKLIKFGIKWDMQKILTGKEVMKIFEELEDKNLIIF